MSLTPFVENAKQTGETIILSGHSAGGRRNYINLLNSDQDQYLDENGRSVLQVQFYGTPANNLDIIRAAEYSGATYLGSYQNSGDFVTNVLGGNNGLYEGIWSAGHVFHLFEPGNETLGIKLESPHSNYYCQGSQCNYNKNP